MKARKLARVLTVLIKLDIAKLTVTEPGLCTMLTHERLRKTSEKPSKKVKESSFQTRPHLFYENMSVMQGIYDRNDRNDQNDQND